MAGGTRLSSRAGARLPMLLAIVLVLHALALNWLARYLEQASALKPLATPMFTRLLQPEAPTAAPVPMPRAAPAKPKRPAITSIAKSAARAKPPVAAASSPAASEQPRRKPARPILPRRARHPRQKWLLRHPRLPS